MKVIDLLQRIANGEIHYSKKFRFSHKDYCTATQFFERYIVDKENLNLEIKELEDTPKEESINRLINTIKTHIPKPPKEDKNIEKLNEHYYHDEPALIDDMAHKINEIIDKLNGEE